MEPEFHHRYSRMEDQLRGLQESARDRRTDFPEESRGSRVQSGLPALLLLLERKSETDVHVTGTGADPNRETPEQEQPGTLVRQRIQGGLENTQDQSPEMELLLREQVSVPELRELSRQRIHRGRRTVRPGGEGAEFVERGSGLDEPRIAGGEAESKTGEAGADPR